jgi:hypothetical protein
VKAAVTAKKEAASEAEKEKKKEKLVEGKMKAEAGMKYHNKPVAKQCTF